VAAPANAGANAGASANAGVDGKSNPQMIAALPIGGRVKLDPWYDRLELIKSKPVGTVAEREKMPFEVTPFMPYLTRYNTEAKPISASSPDIKAPETAASAADSKPADPSKP